MDEIPDDPKIFRLPTIGRMPPKDLIADDGAKRDALRREIIGLLATEPDDPFAAEPPHLREREWIPAPLRSDQVSPSAPTPGHRNAIECPQCDHWTWQATEKCLWCSYNLFDHYQREEAEKLERRRERLREHNTAIRQRLAMWMLGLLAGGVILVGKSIDMKPPLNRWMVYAGFAAMVAGLIVSRCMPRD